MTAGTRVNFAGLQVPDFRKQFGRFTGQWENVATSPVAARYCMVWQLFQD